LNGGGKAIVIVLFIAIFSFCMAISIEKKEKGRKQKLLLTVAIVVILSILAFIKICGHYNTFADYLIIPIGISYFSLSIVGYLLDVYWKKDIAEQNIGHFLTFIFFFPKIIQGPISRHKWLNNQLIDGNHFNYKKICFGLQLVIWGIFKKIVIADRMDILTSEVYSNLEIYVNYGLILMITMVISALQLYFDFSGYTDIAIGISQMFGIELEQNFNHPFFSRSASEFWQRWHMSLSGWFKDYLFLPVSRSKFVKDLSKKMGMRYGATARKKTMMVMSTAVVWMATGLWHGTGINYIIWGMYWGGVIIFSEIFSAKFEKIEIILHINTTAPTWKWFQVLRTTMIFIIGKMISAQNTLYDVKIIIYGIIKNTHFSDLGILGSLNPSRIDGVIIILGILFLFMVSCVQENGIHIRDSISKWNAVPRWVFYCFSLIILLLIGMYGSGYDTSTFAYQFF